ncbi:signal peptidase [Paraburkholderia sp. Ac-20340]|uniref:signal peptidase n=1 Tax=Paraburkholderia sp. Ac-20340 TaxID=2703888 RepID=UPI00197DF9CC|nr:signal peptidase [Paraburkholderia sp. Ac-20340]MBN3852268.1 signal peptidase [Paraburkholderia sp. Ac-20340]
MRTPSLTLSAAALISLTLAACGTELKTLPLQGALHPVTSVTNTANAAPATPNAVSDVAVYFGAQPHADVVHRIGDASHAIRVARATDDGDVACNKALAEGLDKLRNDAREKKANAVINVTTRFHGSHSESSTEFNCGLSRSAAAIVVKGDLVVLQAN